MACRKAAYKSLTEMSEYMEKQNEKAIIEKTKLEQEQRKIWTPRDLLEQCCIPWLVDGSEILGHSTNGYATRGCSGGCGKDHPRIVLEHSTKACNSSDTDLYRGSAVTLTHALDPFVAHFEELCQQGLAKRKEITTEQSNDMSRGYRLSGFLQDHVERLQNSSRFGFHLVELSPTVLAASKRAHERFAQSQEEILREAKRQKRLAASLKDDSTASDNKSLFEKALEICHANNSFLDHLDLLEISWMRLSGNKTMAIIAAKLARRRLQHIRLTYSVLVNGKLTKRTEMTTKDSDEEGRIWFHRGYHAACVDYDVSGSHRLLKSSFENPEKFIPHDQHLCEYQWRNTDIADQIADSDDLLRGHFAPFTESRRRWPIVIRVFLESFPSHFLHELAEKDCLFRETIEVERYRMNIDEGIQQELQRSACSNFSFKIVPDQINTEAGRFSIESIHFGFGDLLGIYARKKLPLAKKNLDNIRRKRPATSIEKEYVKGIAKIAREAPRSKESLLLGWTP